MRIAAIAFAIGLTFTAKATACSPLPEFSPADIFRDDDVIFKGVAVAAEAMNLPVDEVFTDDLVLAVKVRWRIQELYKGQLPKEDWAMTNYICGGVSVVVGQPYIVALWKLELDTANGNVPKRWVEENSNVKWTLDERGTKAQFNDPNSYDRLSEAFKNLSKK
jgi:hypothetical protein